MRLSNAITCKLDIRCLRQIDSNLQSKDRRRLIFYSIFYIIARGIRASVSIAQIIRRALPQPVINATEPKNSAAR